MTVVPFQTILVGVDESEVSDRALVAAIALAKALTARLIIAHVLNSHKLRSPYTHPASTGVVNDPIIHHAYEQEWFHYVSHYESMLQQGTDAAIAAGVDADFINSYGSPESALCELARIYNSSLLVVGSHQRRGMAEIILGSTSNYVVHHAPCSVLVVHAGDKVAEEMTNEITAYERVAYETVADSLSSATV